MILALNILLGAVALPAAVACLYLLAATLLSSAPPRPTCQQRRLHFDLIVPAHNEAGTIQRTLTSLHNVDWPADRYRVLVIADNCSDRTADVARAAGADVLERFDEAHRGKGYALRFGFDASRRDGFADAVVVIDADAEVSRNLLVAIAARIDAGAHAVQVHYGVLNPWTSWRTRLITIAKASFHIVRSRARERLRLSCGIRGNGWSVTHALLARVPYESYSLTEDLEYGIELGLAGFRVHYAEEAHADAEMVSDGRAAERQRQRWEGGRFGLIRSRTLPLLISAVRQRSLVCLDLALDLLVLPLSYVALNTMTLLVAAAIAAALNPAAICWVWISAACVASLTLYVLRGWQLSGLGMRGLLDLIGAPWFLIWKLIVLLSHRASGEWIRTEREK